MIRWILGNLGTAPGSDESIPPGVKRLDVRDLVDKSGNSTETTRQKLDQGCGWLAEGRKVVVCCDYGISRSNAIAAGILALHLGITFNRAVQMVVEATGEQEIKLEPLKAVRSALAENSTAAVTPGSSKSVLVTGGSGYVGQYVLARLGPEYSPVAPSRDQVDLNEGAIMLDLLVRQNEPNCVVHLASPRVFTSNKALGQMLTMLRNVIEVCCEHDIILVFPSSWEIYSAYTSEKRLAGETLAPLTRGPLGEAKLLCENLINIHRCQSGLKCALIRSATLIGDSSDRPRFIGTFIKKALQAKDIFTHQYANGPAHLDLLHIDDYAIAIKAAINSSFTGDLNLGSGQSVTTREIARFIVDFLDSDSALKTRLIEDSAPNIAMDTSKALKSLSWQPRIQWKTALEGLLQGDSHRKLDT